MQHLFILGKNCTNLIIKFRMFKKKSAWFSSFIFENSYILIYCLKSVIKFITLIVVTAYLNLR